MSLDKSDWLMRTPEGLPEGWHNDERYIALHRGMLEEAIAEGELLRLPESKHSFAVAVCGGGKRLFTNAYVCIRMLREIGEYSGPIYMWYLGDCEMDLVMKSICEKLDVTLVDAREMFPLERRLNGWELKAYATAYTPASRVFLIDSDNSVAIPLAEIVGEAESAMRAMGPKCCAAAWPDYSRLEHDRVAWRMTGVEYRDEPEFESGQLLFDRESGVSVSALAAILHMNRFSDFFYEHVHGDKETFHLGLRAARAEYAMCPTGIHSLDATMVQHTHITGRKALYHRNMDKWVLDGSNRVIRDFVVEMYARQYLAELREQWTGDILPGSPSDAANAIRDAVLCRGQWKYERVGHDSRLMTFLEDGKVGYGAARCEHTYRVTGASEDIVLWMIAESGEVIARLVYDVSRGEFEGAWLRYEKMPVKITRPL